MSELKHTCCARVQKNYLFHLCGKTAKFERDNKWYCGMHDPIAVAAKYAKRKEAHEENLRAFYKAQEEKKETQRRADLYPELLDALKMMVIIAREARIHWDNDRDVKVGKLLIALSGDLPNYDNRIPAIHSAIAQAEGKA